MNLNQLKNKDTILLIVVVFLGVALVFGVRHYKARDQRLAILSQALDQRTSKALQEIIQSSKNMVYVGYKGSYTMVPKPYLAQVPESKEITFSDEPQADKKYLSPFQMAFNHSNVFTIFRVNRKIVEEQNVKISKKLLDQFKATHKNKVIAISDTNSVFTFSYEIVNE